MWDVEEIVGNYKGMFADAGEQEFCMNIMDYNPKTGLFLAKGQDIFGNSAIIGLIKKDEIKFEKFYSKLDCYPIFDIKGKTIKNRNLSEDSNLRKIDYVGNIFAFKTLTLSGSWFRKGESNLSGIWRLFSEKD
jgi:hypothetical protein